MAARKEYDPKLKVEKLELLMEIEGYDDELEMLERGTFDGVCAAICMNLGCDYSTDMEPDQDSGWCEECETNTVASALILKDMI